MSTVESQRDVVFTPFMLRVRAALDGEAGGGDDGTARVRPSSLRPIAAATDEWFSLRCRSEQVIAEANGMLSGRTVSIDLEDEVGTGRLAFVLRHRERFLRIWLGQVRRQAWVELERSWAPGHQPVEPEEPAVLEDLVVELLGPGGSGEHG